MKEVCTLKLLCNLSHKKSREVAASLPGRFLSRRCFTPCITMEVEPRIVKQYKCYYCCSCKNYRGKGMEGGEKVSLRRFLAGREFVGGGGGGGTVYKGKRFTNSRILDIKTHTKPTETYQYLHRTLCHPD